MQTTLNHFRLLNKMDSVDQIQQYDNMNVLSLVP